MRKPRKTKKNICRHGVCIVTCFGKAWRLSLWKLVFKMIAVILRLGALLLAACLSLQIFFYFRVFCDFCVTLKIRAIRAIRGRKKIISVFPSGVLVVFVVPVVVYILTNFLVNFFMILSEATTQKKQSAPTTVKFSALQQKSCKKVWRAATYLLPLQRQLCQKRSFKPWNKVDL